MNTPRFPRPAGLAAVWFCICFTSCRSDDMKHAAKDEMVKAERAFSAASVQGGMRDAFIAYLADDGIVFTPHPVNGRTLWAARDSVAGTLIWEPSHAEVSLAGDLGFTWGPWEFRGARGTAYGHFHSIWKQQADGVWRVALDIGGSHEKPAQGLGQVELTGGPGTVEGEPNGSEADLEALDADLSRVTQTRGIGNAITERAAEDVRWSQEGALPVQGRDAVRAALGPLAGDMSWTPQGSGIATTRDLGYTYGIAAHVRDDGADSSAYLHVWRRSPEGWQLALSVQNPL